MTTATKTEMNDVIKSFIRKHGNGNQYYFNTRLWWDDDHDSVEISVKYGAKGFGICNWTFEEDEDPLVVNDKLREMFYNVCKADDTKGFEKLFESVYAENYDKSIDWDMEDYGGEEADEEEDYADEVVNEEYVGETYNEGITARLYREILNNENDEEVEEVEYEYACNTEEEFDALAEKVYTELNNLKKLNPIVVEIVNAWLNDQMFRGQYVG